MLPRNICIVGLHTLFVLHVAHSFVLLTANIDDLKKIARKLVSDQLAEKIVQLLAQVTSGLVTPRPNMSEENEANAAHIQQVSDNEIMDPYKGRQGPKLALRTTPASNRHADNAGDNVKPSKIKVNSQYAESDLRSQELTELSEYRNPLEHAMDKPNNDLPSNNQRHVTILRQSPEPQYLLSHKLDGEKGASEIFNTEKKKPKFSYHKSKIPDKSRNFGAQYASVNIGGGNRDKTNPSTPHHTYSPVAKEEDRGRNPKILDLKYQEKNNRIKEYLGKVKGKGDQNKELIGHEKKRKEKSEEYLDKLRKLVEKEIEDKYKKIKSRIDKKYVKPKVTEQIVSDRRIKSASTSKNGTLHMFVQKGDRLQDLTSLTTEKERLEFDQYQPKHKFKHALRLRMKPAYE